MKRRFQQFYNEKVTQGVTSASDAAANKVQKCSQYALTILRFRQWLLDHDYKKYVKQAVNIEGENPHDIFSSIKIPVPMEIIQKYLDGILLKKDGQYYSFSKASAFWSAYIHAGGDKIP